ncbi:thiol reductant ABC exporter subunit CydC [Numidum massiliense]|uniref:thiol reductant ABC exporter subunit CydC n=1 Tax=Numidum massiliense TaxID=1522315 RepID=UPI0006D56198|nr:thiol reductant ABC exporter subunit CydC [Numidum massiliense]
MNGEGWLRPYVQKHRWRLLLAVALGVLGVASSAALMFTSGYLISEAALRPRNIMLLYVPIVAVRAFSIGQAALRYVERLVGHDTVLRILAAMRERLYVVLEPQALFIRSRYRTGDMLGVLSDDIEHLQDVYLRTVFPSLVSLCIYGIFIFSVGLFDWSFALLMALYAAVLVFVLPLLSLAVTRRKHVQLKRGRNQLYQKLTDAVLGINDWLVSGRKDEFVRAYEASERELARVERKVHAWAHWRGLLAEAVLAVAVLSMVAWSGQQAAADELSAVLIAAFVLVTLPLMNTFVPMSEAVEKLPRYNDSLRRIAAVEERQAEQSQQGETGGQGANEGTSQEHVIGGGEVKALRQGEGDASRVPPSGVVSPNGIAPSPVAFAQSVHIRLDCVSYRYPGIVNWILRDVSLDIPHGKKVALIGRSGAGKSTVLKLVQGALQPERGSVTANGIDVHRLGDGISRVVSVLNQSPHLFDTTVGNNIRLGRPDASDEEVREAARKAQLHELIESLPHGYDTLTHEMGQRFSGGERQRIALARILLQDAPIVVLDEPTIGLDPHTENALLSTVFQVTKDKTLLWVTHHLTGVEQMDDIVFLEDGQVAMTGSHSELLAQSARYRQLYALDVPAALLKT